MFKKTSSQFTLSEFVSRKRIAYVLKHCQNQFEFEIEQLLHDDEESYVKERLQLEKNSTTLQNRMRAIVTYEQKPDISCDYRYWPCSNQGVLFLPRVVRNAVLDSTLYVDIDTKSSNPNYLMQICKKYDVPCRLLCDYFESKAHYHGIVRREYGMAISEKACKQLFLSLINGGSFAGWVAKFSKKDKFGAPSGFFQGDDISFFAVDRADQEYKFKKLGKIFDECKEATTTSKKRKRETEITITIHASILAFAEEMVDICNALRNKPKLCAEWDRAFEHVKKSGAPTPMGTFMYLLMIKMEVTCIVGVCLPWLLDNGYGNYMDRGDFIIYELDGFKLIREVLEAKGGLDYVITTLQNLVKERTGFDIVLDAKEMETKIDVPMDEVEAMTDEEVDDILGGTKQKFDQLYSALKRMKVSRDIADYCVLNNLKKRVYGIKDCNDSFYIYADNNYGMMQSGKMRAANYSENGTLIEDDLNDM
jgi:hypothetical protein